MRVLLVSHAATAATRTAAFPGDEPPEENALLAAKELATRLPRLDRAYCAPSTRCRRTAEALGVSAVMDAALAGCDFGSWIGRTLDEVVAEDPDGVTAWLTEPSASPHGGESVTELLHRVGRWLDGLDPNAGRGVLAVTDPTVVRAAVVHALDARPRSIWRIDVAPLTRTLLTGEPGRWSLRSISRPTDDGPADGAGGGSSAGG